ncbi:pyridoxamine 5'-phosphate oxidase [Armillaria gallica]|uniref:pyridoxal 5'-phosphate synthase n=1 Tax=Armillaria gallica TaxID=47427 RepID=A0A2H3DQR8_ARMGA|nr:pyridoxamine 5'-phosphate oxidase [Armillaria gallica]
MTTLDPLKQFTEWFEYAKSAEVTRLDLVTVPDTEAMTLCTSTPLGIPSARLVALKAVDTRGFSIELDANPHAALVFYWSGVRRSVRVVGKAHRISRAESEEHWRSRPRETHLGAWASPQSQVLRDAGEVPQRLEEVSAHFEGMKEVEMPEFWGGWRVVPDEVEFWSGKASRLHDRQRYLRQEDGEWKVDCLAP